MHITGRHIAIFFLTCLVFVNCVRAQENNIASTPVDIVFHNVAGGKVIHIDSSYTNAFGEVYSIKKLKYYVSHICLWDSNANKSESFDNDYFLIDESDDASKSIHLRTSLLHITSIKFLLGIDSLQNVAGVQTGALDPANGMFWVWNTGYVMAKLEGVSPVANVAGHYFSHDVGGYKPVENTVRLISLPIMDVPAANTIHIKANIDRWFNGVHPVSISLHPLCHEPGILAVQIADNFSTMFSIIPPEE